ncbi:hypothetical protein ABEB36_002911 [Hypothenemus hampei]|uniref:MADF domain-containing protein n=1 Tax=Hypothenemus hampei TaxID=57062 RepID=A0ABD1F7G6_HYPHA
MGRLLKNFVDSKLKFDGKLASLVKNNNHIYDTRTELFQDHMMQLKTWSHIAQQLGKTESYCIYRWHRILKRLFDEVTWMNEFKVPSQWLLYPQLDFLLNVIDQKALGIHMTSCEVANCIM